MVEMTADSMVDWTAANLVGSKVESKVEYWVGSRAGHLVDWMVAMMAVKWVGW